MTVNLTNCANQGAVIGTEKAGLFCWGASGNLTEDALDAYNKQISGTCTVDKLDGFAASIDANGQVIITRETSDAANVAYYSVGISAYTEMYTTAGMRDGTDMYAIEKTVEIGNVANGETINTGIYRYDFRQLNDTTLQALATTLETSAASVIKYAVAENGYTVVTSNYDTVNDADIVTIDGVTYYLFKNSMSTTGEVKVINNPTPSVTVYAYDSTGKLIGSITIK